MLVGPAKADSVIALDDAPRGDLARSNFSARRIGGCHAPTRIGCRSSQRSDTQVDLARDFGAPVSEVIGGFERDGCVLDPGALDEVPHRGIVVSELLYTPIGYLVRCGGESMTTIKYQVTGMTCAHCEDAITQAVGQLAGVENIDVSAATGILVVTSTGELDDAVVLAAVEEAGYAGVRS